MTERKLASIQRIAEIKDIPDADLIQAYRIGGWWIVSKKGEFAVGELVTYLEIDSWVPTELAPFLSKGKEPREYMGVKGERLRTVRLKKQLSQGLILPVTIHAQIEDCDNTNEGSDVTEILGVIKWNPPEEFIPANAKGNFPSFIPKTDQERIQNLYHEVNNWLTDGSIWQKTEKLDGSSMTVFVNADHSGVCSRNLELLEDENNTYWKMTKKYKLLEALRSTGRNLAIQGEIYGMGINGNLYGLDDQRFALYSIYDIDQQVYLAPEEAYNLSLSLGVPHVPHKGIKRLGDDFSSLNDIIQDADGFSAINPKSIREGYVYKNVTTNESFKVVSSSYLLKKG